MLGLRPWFALERRAFNFFFWVRFDMEIEVNGVGGSTHPAARCFACQYV